MGAVVIEEVLAVQQFTEAHVRRHGHNGHAESDDHDHPHDDEEPRFREKEAHKSRFDR